MPDMRIYDKLRAQILTDYNYTWDTSYGRLLFKDDLGADTRVTTETALTYGNGVYVDNTFDFILPRVQRYNTALDGVARGNLRFHVLVDDDGAQATYSWIKTTVSLISRTVGGVDTTLATTTTLDLYHTVGIGGAAIDLSNDVPFFIDVDLKKHDITQKLILRVLVQAKRSSAAGAIPTAYLVTRLNLDDVFVELPLI